MYKKALPILMLAALLLTGTTLLLSQAGVDYYAPATTVAGAVTDRAVAPEPTTPAPELSAASQPQPLLSLAASQAGISAGRETSLALQTDGALRVQDFYQLTVGPAACDLTLAYPLALSLAELAQAEPVFTWDGGIVSYGLAVGAEPLGAEWTALAADAAYLTAALEPAALSCGDMVTLYQAQGLAFTDQQPPADQGGFSLSFTLDPAQTSLLAYGFDSWEWDPEHHSLTVFGNVAAHGNDALLIAVGEPLDGFDLAGYTDAAHNRRSARFSGQALTSTASLSAVLQQIAELLHPSDQTRDPELAALLNQARARLLAQAADQFHQSVPTEDQPPLLLLSETLDELDAAPRLVFLTYPAQLPAGASLSCNISFSRPAAGLEQPLLLSTSPCLNLPLSAVACSLAPGLSLPGGTDLALDQMYEIQAE